MFKESVIRTKEKHCTPKRESELISNFLLTSKGKYKILFTVTNLFISSTDNELGLSLLIVINAQ